MFTYSIQLARYPHEKFDEMGELTFNEFEKTFDAFPWLEQCDKYDKIQEGCSATISVTSSSRQQDLWISIAGNTNKYSFLIGYNYFKTKKGFLGIGKEKEIKWVDIYEIEDIAEIKHLFKLFFDEQSENLAFELKKLKLFDSMQAVS